MTSNLVLSALFLVAFFVVGDACKCRPLTQKEVWDQSEFVGRMRIVTKTYGNAVLTYTADYIDPIYKPPNQFHILIPVPIVTSSSSASCGVTELKIGKDYLITATYNNQSVMQINSCSGMPPRDGEFSSPLGALSWKLVTPKLKKKLETGKF